MCKIKSALNLHKSAYDKCALDVSRPHNISKCYNCPKRNTPREQGRHTYTLEITEYKYITNIPIIYTIPFTGSDISDALDKAEDICEEYARTLNRTSKSLKVRLKKPFKADIDGSNEFDYVVRFWDGDDYQTVKGIRVINENTDE